MNVGFSEVRLRNDARIIRHQNEVRFRIGIWNHEEGVLDSSSFSEGFNEVFHSIIDKLIDGESITQKDIYNTLLLENEKISILTILGQLKESGYLVGSVDDFDKELSHLLLGAPFEENSPNVKSVSKVLLITDNDFTQSHIESISENIGINLTVADFIDDLFFENLQSEVDGYSLELLYNKYEKIINEYSYCIVALQNLHINMLRNLNRLLMRFEIPFTLSFIDGPFISMTTIKTEETACFECFEQRALARLEDHVSYIKYIKAETTSRKKMIDNSQLHFTPMLSILGTASVTEAYLFLTTGYSKLMGKVLNVYVPTFEIQYQDMLRIPYCPACGHISKAKVKEMNASADVAIKELFQKINA